MTEFSDQQKADAFDDLVPELTELHEICERLGCPSGERIVLWAARELERLSFTADGLKRQNRDPVR